VIHYQHPKYDPSAQYLFAAWHSHRFLPVLGLNSHDHNTKVALLVDDAISGDRSLWFKSLGYEIVRVSSENVNALLEEMTHKLKKKYSAGIMVDGPRGPMRQVKPGITYLAQKFKVPIIPVGSAFSKKWIVEKAWDKYEIPKPFASVALYLGEPLVIDETADLAMYNRELGKAIDKAEAMARTLLSLS
jgi:lysophospholipid acyltransferase (LPLAT)-like uncharacterized protein